MLLHYRRSPRLRGGRACFCSFRSAESLSFKSLVGLLMSSEKSSPNKAQGLSYVITESWHWLSAPEAGLVLLPPKHPYYGKKGYDHYSKRGIRHCAISGDKLAANLDKNEECEVLRNLSQKGKDDRQKWEDRHKEVKKVVDTLCGEDKKRTINQPVLVAPMPLMLLSIVATGDEYFPRRTDALIYTSVRIESCTK